MKKTKMLEKITKTGDITVFQLRAARRALNLTVREVAKAAGVATGVIVRAEAGDLYSFPQNVGLVSVARLKIYLESYGIVFLSNNTIRLERDTNIVVLRSKN